MPYYNFYIYNYIYLVQIIILKNKRILLGLILVILLICLIPINLQSTRILTTSNLDLKTSQTNDNLRYDFGKNNLDTSNKTNVNLRHNNIITGDYNGTYSFVNDINGNVPIGWNNLSVGNGRTVALISTIDKHYAMIRLKTIDTDDARIEQEFDDGSQIEGIIEFWFRTSEATKTSYIRVFSNTDSCINIRITGDVFQMYESGVPTTLDTIPIDNDWYHFKIGFDCITDTSDIWINGYYEGIFDFNIIGISLDTLDFLNAGAGNYLDYYDAIGYSWDPNYIIGENIYPNIQKVDSNILSSDKYQFNLNESSEPYNVFTTTEVYGWTEIGSYPEGGLLGPFNPYVECENMNGVFIHGIESTIGIRNQSLKIYGDKINITFGLQFIDVSHIDSYLNITIKSLNDDETIVLQFSVMAGNLVRVKYYNSISFIPLFNIENVISSSIYTFNMYIENFEVKISWFKDYVYVNAYTFPLIINRSGIKTLEFLGYGITSSVNYIFLRLNFIGIYQYNVSLTKEKGYIDYNLQNDWDFQEYNLLNFDSNQSIKLIGRTFLPHPVYIYFVFREFNNDSFTYNLYGVENTIEKPHLYLIIQSNFDISESLFLSIEGLKLDKYIDSVFDREITIKYYYHNLNTNQSYYYLDDSNRLHYHMDITQNDTLEYMMLYFDFVRHIGSDNKSIYFKCRELSFSIGESYIAMTYYQPPDNLFYLKTYETTINTLLILGKEFRRFHFVITDKNNNNNTDCIAEGYLYGLQFNYIPFGIPPIIPILEDFMILSLIAIMIPLIILIVPTLGIYSVYKKKEIIIPVLLLMSIICFVSNLIPLELFFVMILCFGSIIFIQYKRGFNQE